MKEDTTEQWNRHTLVWLTPQGRLFSADHIYTQPWEAQKEEAWKKQLVSNPLIPGIICRQPGGTGGIDTGIDTGIDGIRQPHPSGILFAGFSHWTYHQGTRLRMAAAFQEAEVWKSRTPFDLCLPRKRELLCSAYPFLEPAFLAADKYGVVPGLIGSTALEWVTAYPYRNQNSDIDLIIRQTADSDLEGFGRTIYRLEKQHGIRLDVEVEVTIKTAGSYGIKLTELISPSKTVMGKGLYNIQLFDKESLMHIGF